MGTASISDVCGGGKTATAFKYSHFELARSRRTGDVSSGVQCLRHLYFLLCDATGLVGSVGMVVFEGLCGKGCRSVGGGSGG